MAVIHLTRGQKIEGLYKKWCEDIISQAAIHKIKKKDIAEVLDVCPSAISHQFNKKEIKAETALAVQFLIEEKEKR